jgi:hypothetical protein
MSVSSVNVSYVGVDLLMGGDSNNDNCNNKDILVFSNVNVQFKNNVTVTQNKIR